MGRKIFVSYKYGDTDVESLNGYLQTKVRNYVDELQYYLDSTDNIYKGENDGQNIGTLADSTIASKLGDKIFDSSVTIVFISSGMKDSNKEEIDQWIPWEISYSLKKQSREYKTSKTNAVLAVVLPNKNGKYDYFMNKETCCDDNCISYKTDLLFEILRNNMFNRKCKTYSTCQKGMKLYSGAPSYIQPVEWDEFVRFPQHYINIACNIQQHAEDYDIQKIVKKDE